MPLSLSATQTIPESWPDRHDPLQHATSNTPPLERTHTSNPRVTTPPVLHTVPIGTITIVSVLRSSAWAPDVHGGAQSPKPSGSRISGPFVADRFPRAESGKHLRAWLFRALSPSFRCWTSRRTSNPHGGQYGTLPTTRRGVKASASVPPLYYGRNAAFPVPDRGCPTLSGQQDTNASRMSHNHAKCSLVLSARWGEWPPSKGRPHT